MSYYSNYPRPPEGIHCTMDLHQRTVDEGTWDLAGELVEVTEDPDLKTTLEEFLSHYETKYIAGGPSPDWDLTDTDRDVWNGVFQDMLEDPLVELYDGYLTIHTDPEWVDSQEDY